MSKMNDIFAANFDTSRTSMPNINSPKFTNNRICGTCEKADVCMYREDTISTYKEIKEKEENKANVFIETSVTCKKWLGTINNIR